MVTRVLTRSLLTTKQAFSLLRLRPLTAVASNLRHLSPAATSIREFVTCQTTSSLNDSNPNWSNRPPEEPILYKGCDFEHWLVLMEKPEGDASRDDIIDNYIKTLAMVVGSEEEARMKIYSVSTKWYFAFGALVSEELSYKLKELPGVQFVLPDSYLDVRKKDYGGEPFINGQAVPYDPKYHEEWVRNNTRAIDRRSYGPRNLDRSLSFERRHDYMQNQMGNQGMQSTGPNRGGPPSNIGGVPPSYMGGADGSGTQHGGYAAQQHERTSAQLHARFNQRGRCVCKQHGKFSAEEWTKQWQHALSTCSGNKQRASKQLRSKHTTKLSVGLL